ncbi:MAG TPA: divalent-cation tolerance protein CutA [Candidatus Cybelea sp.]|nr:divalent-cation tolerance protein CutA [Candidatus Cybelea sp.]
MMTGVSLVYVTAESPEQAQAIGHALVEEHIAACANIIPGMRSIYWWQGKLEEADETVLIVKTRSENVGAVIRRVKELHSYSVPCVLAWPIDAGNSDYVNWLLGEARTS